MIPCTSHCIYQSDGVCTLDSAAAAGMPVASSQYWNSIHGRTPGEAEADGEGRQTMRTLARNMTFLMRSIALGKEHFGLPEQEARIATHFIR